MYLGLDDGFNARARAANFPSTELAAVARQVHRAGAKLFVTLNTLVFEPELPIVEELVRRVARAGADAIIVQDPAVALIARAIGLPTHASTQMTASSPEAATLVAGLGVTRVVVPRELSVADIRAYHEGAGALELEVFVHGALCVAWSGQCLSSEAWGGRSANRGQCAQACRLPYDLVVDGVTRELGDVAYLLSPKDLVGIEHVAALAEIGVASLKIEGRLKGPGYVATTAAQYRRAVDPAFVPATDVPQDRAALEVAYSRGPSAGFLGGVDHQALVEGRFPRHRGLAAGRVVRVDGSTVDVVRDDRQRPGAPPIEIRAGMGVVFDRSRPDEPEEGGPIFGADRIDGGWRLRFGQPGPELANVTAGDLVWVSSDPRVTRAGEKAAQAVPSGRIPLALTVRGAEGAPLVIDAAAAFARVSIRGGVALAAARGAGLSSELLVDKLGAFGGTAYRLGSLDLAELAPGLHVPPGELKDLRRRVVAALDAELDKPRDLPDSPRIDSLAAGVAPLEAPPCIVPLVRDDAQLDAVLDAGAREVELDWMELVGLARAVSRARARGARVVVATPRIQKPGEDKIDAHLARLEPDAILVRSWGSLAVAPDGVPLHADFSLNVTNSVTARWVLSRRPTLQTLTAAHDLDRDQLVALLDAAPRGRVGVTV
ncbi:MAG TPA: U32 family peptidase, partial [Byssovorax sp.]